MADEQYTPNASVDTEEPPVGGADEKQPQGDQTSEAPAREEATGEPQAAADEGQKDKRERPSGVPYRKYKEALDEQKRLTAELDYYRNQARAAERAPRRPEPVEQPPPKKQLDAAQEYIQQTVRELYPDIDRLPDFLAAEERRIQSQQREAVDSADEFLVEFAEADGYTGERGAKVISHMYRVLAADLLADPQWAEQVITATPRRSQSLIKEWYEEYRADLGLTGRANGPTRASPEKPRPKPKAAPAAHLPKDQGTLAEMRTAELDVSALRQKLKGQGMNPEQVRSELRRQLRERAFSRVDELGRSEMP